MRAHIRCVIPCIFLLLLLLVTFLIITFFWSSLRLAPPLYMSGKYKHWFIKNHLV